MPQLANTGLVIEMRPRKGGSVKVKDPATGKKVRKRFPSDTGQGDFVKASATFGASARLNGAGLPDSPYTLDDPESIVAMMEERAKRLMGGTQGSVMDPDDPDYEYAVAANRDDY